MQKIISKGLTSYNLKIIGIILMVCDHIHEMFVYQGAPEWLTIVGRLVAPIFLFLSAEGFHYTRNRKRYMSTLLIGFIICNILFAAVAKIFPNNDIVLINSIFGTLFFGTVLMWIIDGFRGENQYKVKAVIVAILVLVVSLIPIVMTSMVSTNPTPISVIIMQLGIIFIPSIFLVEGGMGFIILAGVFYLLRNNRKWQMLFLILFSFIIFLVNPTGIQWIMGFSAIFLALYNGKEGKKEKWFFYIFYPTHIIVLYLLATLVL